VNKRERTLIFQKGKRKYLFFLDHQGAELAFPLFRLLIEKKLPFETRVIGTETDGIGAELYAWLSAQKMGTFLYIAGTADLVEQAKVQAYAAGFSDEEMSVIAIGAHTLRVFCVVCEDIVSTPPAEQVTCPGCGKLLTVTDHYSPRLRACLGYVPVT
jgi:hypothetical protein